MEVRTEGLNRKSVTCLSFCRLPAAFQVSIVSINIHTQHMRGGGGRGEQALLTGAASAPTKGRVYFEDRVCWGFSGPCSLLYLAGLLTPHPVSSHVSIQRVILIVVHISYTCTVCISQSAVPSFFFVYCLLLFVFQSWSHYPFKLCSYLHFLVFVSHVPICRCVHVIFIYLYLLSIFMSFLYQSIKLSIYLSIFSTVSSIFLYIYLSF